MLNCIKIWYFEKFTSLSVSVPFKLFSSMKLCDQQSIESNLSTCAQAAPKLTLSHIRSIRNMEGQSLAVSVQIPELTLQDWKEINKILQRLGLVQAAVTKQWL